MKKSNSTEMHFVGTDQTGGLMIFVKHLGHSIVNVLDSELEELDCFGIAADVDYDTFKYYCEEYLDENC